MHLNPCGRQIFQILQMVSTMTIELGLDQATKLAESDPKLVAHNTNDTDAMSSPVRRTRAACYHLASM